MAGSNDPKGVLGAKAQESRAIDISRTKEEKYKRNAAGVQKRIVRTPEGAKYYGKPVGAVITQGEMAEAEARGQFLHLDVPPNATQQYVAEKHEITVTATHRPTGGGKPIVSTFKVGTDNEAKALRAALEAVGATVKTSDLADKTVIDPRTGKQVEEEPNA